jgi:putative hemolysin
MDGGLLIEFLILLALILVNGVFAGAEIAVVTVRPGRVRELAQAGSKSAKALQRLQANPESFLSTVQIGITTVSAAAAALGGASFAEDLVPLFSAWSVLAPYAAAISLALVVALVSYLSIVVGELVPKSLALRARESYALLMARPLLALAFLARPVVWLLTASSNAVLRIFGDHTNFTESRLSLEELRGLVDEASRGGSVPEEAGEIATRALDLDSLTAADVMIHRRFVVGLQVDAKPEQIRHVFQHSGHQRTPVYESSLDKVVGYVSWRDLLPRVWTGDPPPLSELMRPGYFVPETTSALDLLSQMRSTRQHLAIVVDEHGGMSGIVTLEDLLEELVGEIVSEHSPRSAEPIRIEPDGSALVTATAPTREVNRALGIDLGTVEWTTVNGLCLELAGGRIPSVGDRFTAPDGSRIEVLDASPRRVRLVRIVPPASQKPSVEDDPGVAVRAGDADGGGRAHVTGNRIGGVEGRAGGDS